MRACIQQATRASARGDLRSRLGRLTRLSGDAGQGGGGSISMPYLGTIPNSLGMSTSAGFGIVIVFAGSPISAAKRSNWAGEVICSMRALPAGETVNE